MMPFQTKGPGANEPTNYPSTRPPRRLATSVQAKASDVLAVLKSFDGVRRGLAMDLLAEEDRQAIDEAWREWAHDGQLAPPTTPDGSDWSTWVIKAGRGFGKTLAGAKWIEGLIAAHADAPLLWWGRPSMMPGA